MNPKVEGQASGPGPRVLIVGAGPSGLALAIELGLRGIECLVVERNDRVGYAPRAKTTNVRTRTHLRRWGIAGNLADASPFGIDYPSDVHFVTRLAGRRLALIRNASRCAPERSVDYPEHGQWVPQYKLEEVMRAHAEVLASVTIRFNTEFVTAKQDADGVTATLRDRRNSRQSFVDAEYLVGSDGARSVVRELIGATMSGTYGLSRNYNIVFRARGLASSHGHGPGAMYWQVNQVAASLIGPMDRDDIWFFMPTRLPEGFKITQESAADLIRGSTGIDLPYEILSSDEWVASSLIADRYRGGRMFLIGDACHLHPPFGGFGMNMGVADGVDLGWKLAAELQGFGGPDLLDSYEQERRGIHIAVMAEAAANHAVLSNDLWHDDLEDDGPAGISARRMIEERIIALKEREFHTLGTVLGGCYEGSPIIVSDGTATPDADGLHYQATSRPGCLAPHLWRSDGSSLYDSFGDGYALVCHDDTPGREMERAAADAWRAGVPFMIVQLVPGEGVDRYPARMTLIRPDQYVAWRGDHWPSAVLGTVTGWGSRSTRHAMQIHGASSFNEVIPLRQSGVAGPP